MEHISHTCMNITDRIKIYAGYKGISINHFEVKSDIARGSLRYVKQSIGSEKIANIMKAFPDLNVSWLITGEGNMINAIQDESREDFLCSDKVSEMSDTIIGLSKIVQVQQSHIADLVAELRVLRSELKKYTKKYVEEHETKTA